jgi:steroid 5-alpha reductase family enzyme
MIYIIFVIFIIYILLFILSLKLRDNSIVDIFWWLGFIIISLIMFFQNKIINFYSIFTLFIIIIRGLRLSINIFTRNLKLKKEDSRYANWRKNWKYFKTRSFFQIYLLQMSLLFIVAMPIYFIFSLEIKPELFYLWICISIFWLLYESIADYQISKYIKSTKEKSKIYTWWLFKYSRHPNYFWEIVFWLGICIISFSNTYFWIIGFLTISYLLLFVSWIPMKEKRYELKENYIEYKKHTSLIIPWFRKN